jgi:hypothetical protein
MTTHALAVGDTVRVALDPVASRFGSRVGTIEYIDELRARVRFDGDDEFTYWFRPGQLVSAHPIGGDS